MGHPRLRGEPKYVRRTRHGAWQARPYDSISKERINLGLFPTEAAVLKAVSEYWWGKREPRPKYVRLRQFRDGTVRYYVVIRLDGIKHRVGSWDNTAAAAAAAVERFVRRFCPADVADRLLSRKEKVSESSRRRRVDPQDPDPAGEPHQQTAAAPGVRP